MAGKNFSLPFERPLEALDEKIAELKRLGESGTIDLKKEIRSMEARAQKLRQEIYENLTPMQIVQLARHPKRPTTLEYVGAMCEDFVELRGDRAFGDDPAMVGGMASFDGNEVMIIGHQKGKDTKDNIYRNFGMAHPEGYRKALRLMKLAEKFGRPILTFIDTPGAYPGIGAEERGQAEAIARNLREMALLRVPVIAVVTGEGGSGGALGIGVANRVLMLSNSIYSVISPEGCASILFRDATRAQEAAEKMRITAKDLLALGVIDDVIEEPFGGAHTDIPQMAASLKAVLLKLLGQLGRRSPEKLVQDRHEKFRALGKFA